MVHTYPLRTRLFHFVGQDALLAAVVLAFVALRPVDAFARAMLVAIPIALAWSVVTLHWPSRITVDEAGVRFARYGREHAYPWRSIREVRVRRFLVRDRVLVRILPSAPWRGRYWVLDTLEGFDDLIRALEARGALQKESPTPAL